MFLADFMDKIGLTDEQMASMIGDSASASFVRKLRLGKRLPSLKRAIAISKATGGQVALADWEDPPARLKRRGPKPSKPSKPSGNLAATG
jgi:hypothetical protein